MDAVLAVAATVVTIVLSGAFYLALYAFVRASR